MKPGKPLSRSRPKRKPSMELFWLAVTDGGKNPCAICGDVDPRRRKEAHHWVGRSRMERHGAPIDALADDRNGVCLCREPCHERVTNARIPCPRPPDLSAFLDEHQLLESGRPRPKGQAA